MTTVFRKKKRKASKCWFEYGEGKVLDARLRKRGIRNRPAKKVQTVLKTRRTTHRAIVVLRDLQRRDSGGLEKRKKSPTGGLLLSGREQTSGKLPLKEIFEEGAGSLGGLGGGGERQGRTQRTFVQQGIVTGEKKSRQCPKKSQENPGGGEQGPKRKTNAWGGSKGRGRPGCTSSRLERRVRL